MAKTRENHRNKKKAPKVYVELDLKQFNDILKPKESKFKGKKDNRGKIRSNRDKDSRPYNKGERKPYHKDKQSNNNNRNGKPKYNGKPNQNKPKQPK